MVETPEHTKQLMKELASVSVAHDVFAKMTASRSPDKIIIERGRGLLDYYDVMVDADPVLAGLLETRIDAVAGLEWDVIPASEEPNDERIAEFVTSCLDGLKRFKQDLEQICSAARTGFSVCEIIWELKSWNGAQKWMPVKLLSRRPERFTFGENYELRLKTRLNTWEGEELPPNKFIHHIFRPRYENPYGTSLCTSIWWMWWFKHHGMAWWLKAAERGAVVSPIGYYPEGWNEDQIKDFRNFLRTIMNDSYGAVPEGSNVEFPHIKIDKEFASKLREACNEEMIYRILGGTQSSGGDEGSRAKAKVHEHRFQERKEADAESVMATINHQLIKPMVLLNFPEPTDYPYWKLNYEEEKDVNAIADVLVKVAKIGVPVSTRDAAEMVNVPHAEEGETSLIKITGGPSVPGLTPNEPDNPDEEEEPNPEETEDQNTEANFAVSFQSRAAKNAGNMKNLSNAAIEYGMPEYNKLTNQLQTWLSKQGSLERALDNVGDFSLDMKSFTQYLAEARYLSLLYGFHTLTDDPKVRDNLEASKGPIAKKTIGCILRKLFASANKWKPLPFEEAIELFEDRTILERKDFDELLAYEKRQALTAANMTAETLEARLQPALLQALEEGLTLPQFQAMVKDIVMSPIHAENIFRTNIVTAYNEGHIEAIIDPQLQTWVAGVEFRAVSDNRTTDICLERDGQVYKTEDLTALDIAPPCHYMCRSTVTAVFVDEFGGTYSEPPTLRAQEGFGLFSPIRSAA